MVPYYGHHSCKMFIKGKPIRFGYKIWTLCSSDGYPYVMKIFQGKETEELNTPLETSVVTALLNFVTNPLPVEIFFDNFVTSYALLRELKIKLFKAIGTVWEGRTDRCPLLLANEMKKKTRGELDFHCDGDIYMCRWHDNSVVTMSFNYRMHLPVGTSKSFSRQSKKRIEVLEPHRICKYNKELGGVDVFDRLLSSSRPQLRGKRWW